MRHWKTAVVITFLILLAATMAAYASPEKIWGRDGAVCVWDNRCIDSAGGAGGAGGGSGGGGSSFWDEMRWDGDFWG